MQPSHVAAVREARFDDAGLVSAADPVPAVAVAHRAELPARVRKQRNGTIDLFAAMDVGTGKVLTNLTKGHRGADVVKFLKRTDAAVPRSLVVPVVLDNLPADPTPETKKWLALPRRPTLAPSLRRRVHGSTGSSDGSTNLSTGGYAAAPCSGRRGGRSRTLW